MNIARLIAWCRENGIEFRLGSGTVRVRGASDIVEEVLPVLRAHKQEIIDHLAIEIIHAHCLSEANRLEEPRVTAAQAHAARIQAQALLNRVMSRPA